MPTHASSNAKNQTHLSSFFSSPTHAHAKRRAVSPIDLTSDNELDDTSAPTAPPAKKARRRAVSKSPVPVPVQATQSQSKPTRSQYWAFSPDDVPAQTAVATATATGGAVAAPELPRSASEEAAVQRRRQAFKNKLLGPNPASAHSSTSANRARSSDADSSGVHAVPTEGGDADPGLSDESDSALREMREMFSMPGAKKGKGKASETTTKKGKASPKKKAEVGPSGETWTPLEKQVLQLKKDHPETLLMIEVGYKYRFYGDDAKIASQELGIVCYPYRNFLSASIPVHRREVHLRKLLSKGYKVGIVDQQETAALKKAGDNRNTLFLRGLSHLYTATTYVDELDSVDEMERHSAPPLMCLVEELRGGMGADERVHFGMITISPGTGDVVYDAFDDTYMRGEVETRLVHINPSELLLPKTDLSKPTEKMLLHFVSGSNGAEKARVERFAETMSYTDASTFVTDFYSDKSNEHTASEEFQSGKLMAAITHLPKSVIVALAHAIKYLSSFNMADAFLATTFFSAFATRSHMLLNSNTLSNLEIYQNETDYTSKGSLVWVLNHTTTKFGARLLRSWIGRPLIDRQLLQERFDAVDEMKSLSSMHMITLKQLLKGLPDFAKGLSRIQYGKCTPQELAILLPAFNRIATTFQPVSQPSDYGMHSSMLNEILFTLPKLREPLRSLLDAIDLQQTKEGNKDAMWRDPEKYPDIEERRLAITVVETELRDELREIRKLLKRPGIQWTSWNTDEYLIELKKTEKHLAPATWSVISSTKTLFRYQIPEVYKKSQERSRHKESLQLEANKAYLSFLSDIARDHYAVLRAAVNKLAMADCLFSFAHVALEECFVRPDFTEHGGDGLTIVDGRHPMSERVRSDPFVPNSITMGCGQPRSKIITGPNMGGKSSSVGMIALIAIMAQVGSYVPATSVTMGLLDGIMTRMGAFDELARGRSTFMVELAETSDILHGATDKTLVILDELGRGTSTYDGMAVASATLHHLVQQIRCKTLFITHYPLVARELELKFPSEVENLHMGFTEDTRIDGTREITFLYRLTKGMATNSFGVECGRLAGLPEKILQLASERSEEMRKTLENRTRKNIARKCTQALLQCLGGADQIDQRSSLSALREAMASLQIASRPSG